MPVGPSHSGRSGGGSHGGGFGGSRGGGGPHGGPHHGPRSSDSFVNGMIGGMIGASIANRRRERFERTYGIRPTDDEYDSMPRRTKPTGFLILSIVVAFFMLCTFFMLASANSNIKEYNSFIATMEADYKDYYKPMIDAVTATDYSTGKNNYYTTTAEFSTQKISYYSSNPTISACYEDFTSDNVQYYFIVYKYTDKNGEKRTGTTYTQFSSSQIPSNGEIKIAYYDYNGEHYSINLNYKLEDCEEYLHYKTVVDNAKSSKKGVITALVIETIIIALFITLYVLQVKKYYKLVAQDEELLFQKKKAEAEKATAEANEVKSRTNKFCRYCGSKLEANTTKCPSCGARLTK